MTASTAASAVRPEDTLLRAPVAAATGDATTAASVHRIGGGDAGENVGRLKSELRRNPGAMAALLGLGLNGATVDRLHLGLKAPYRSRADGLETRDALCFPVLAEGLRPVGRYAYLNLAGVTVNAHAPVGWGPGKPLVYRLGSFAADAVAVVAADVVDAWLAWQLSRGGHPETAFLSRSHCGDWPAEWRSSAFWSGFSRVLLLPGRGAPDFLREIAPGIGRDLSLIALPAPHSSVGSATTAARPPSFDELVGSTEPWMQAVPVAAGAVPAEQLGRFAATPVSVTGAYSGGHLYYPFAVEERRLQREGRADAGRVVHSYATMVLRSDGHLLATELLPAPRGTPADQRILCLSDGTRIAAEPVASRTGTWSFASIEAFANWRTRGGAPPFRPLGDLVADVEGLLRSRAWLPVDGQHLLAALYVVMSHLFQVFDAIPLLLVVGERGTGKSELGEAIARLSFNATVAGQLRAAGMIRLLDETRGLLVLDDMDGDGPASVVGTGELAQALKTSYKRATSRKPIADRGGRVRMVDFYGPKVVSTTRGVDAVLGSRMLAVVTAPMPAGASLGPGRGAEAELDGLRDELHCWAMSAAGEVAAAYAAAREARTDRRAEIEAPLLALAGLAGEDVLARLRAALADPRTAPAPRA